MEENLMRRLVSCAFVAIVVLAGCYDPVGPGINPHRMTAEVDGVEWIATSNLTVTYTNAVLTFSGLDAQNVMIRVSLANVTGANTYFLNPGNPNGALGNIINGASIWGSNISGGTGTLNVTLLDSSRVAGTFSFTAVPASGGAQGTRTVANGSFGLNR